MKNFFFTPIPDLTDTYKDSRVDREIPEMLIYLKLWGSNTTKLWTVHVIATFFSLLTASLIGNIDDQYSRIFGFIAALSISLLTAFNLGAKSNNTRNAWRRLNAAIMKFNEHMINKDALMAAYEQGESLVGGVHYTQDRIERDELVTDDEISEVRKTEKPNTSEHEDHVNKHLKREK